jgi:hypothetical protein
LDIVEKSVEFETVFVCGRRWDESVLKTKVVERLLFFFEKGLVSFANSFKDLWSRSIKEDNLVGDCGVAFGGRMGGLVGERGGGREG